MSRIEHPALDRHSVAGPVDRFCLSPRRFLASIDLRNLTPLADLSHPYLGRAVKRFTNCGRSSPIVRDRECEYQAAGERTVRTLPQNLRSCGVSVDRSDGGSAVDDLGGDDLALPSPGEPGNRGFQPRRHIAQSSAARIQNKKVSTRGNEVTHQPANQGDMHSVRRPLWRSDLQFRLEDRNRMARINVDPEKFGGPPIVIAFSVGCRAARGRRRDEATAIRGPVVFVDEQVGRREQMHLPGSRVDQGNPLLAIVYPDIDDARICTLPRPGFRVQHRNRAAIRRPSSRVQISTKFREPSNGGAVCRCQTQLLLLRRRCVSNERELFAVRRPGNCRLV